jgi:hypothetical protein
MFSQWQIKQADLARKLYRLLGRPDEKEFRSILQNNLILNCPVTPDDAQRALLAIYGPDVATHKGKMTRAGAVARAPTFEAVPIPLPIRQHHCNVTLCIDFFFVQGVPFLHTIFRGMGYRTAVPVADGSYNTILKQTRSVIKLYTLRGFHVRDIHADEEFDCIRADVLPINLNVVGASIRPIKKCVRACAHGLPY